MGGSVKKIVGVAAAIAAPIAAPAIASSIGLSGAIASATASTAIGTTVGSAITGGVLGGVAAEATGGDFERGAIGGAIGGGIGGYTRAAGAAANAPASAQPGVAGGPGAGSAAAASGGPTGVPAAGVVDPTAAGTAATGTGAGSVSAGGGAPPNIRPGVGPQSVASGAGGAGSSGFTLANAGENVREWASSVGSDVVDRVSEVDYADAALKAAGSIAGQYVAGDGVSEEERQLIEAQKRDLELLRERNADAFRERLDAARNMIGEARYFDPQYFGMSAQSDVQMRSAQQQREAAREAALRPGRAGLSMGEQRRGQLGSTVAGQSAYVEGAEQARRQGLEAYQAGLSALPQPSQYSALGATQDVQRSVEAARLEREQAEEEAGQLFGSVLGTNDRNGGIEPMNWMG